MHGYIQMSRLLVLFIIRNSSFVNIIFKILTVEFLRSILMLIIPEFLLSTHSNSKIITQSNGTIGKRNEDKDH